MLQQFQKPVSNLSAAIQIALSETWPPKRNRSQEFLDFNLNKKPLGTEFAAIWFRQGKPHQRTATAWAPRARAGQAGVMQSGDYTHSDGLHQPPNDSQESWSIISNGKLVWKLDTEHPPTWKSPSCMAGISLSSYLSHDCPYLFSGQTKHKNPQIQLWDAVHLPEPQQ